MPEVKLDAADAAELAEMLQFLSGWLARDPGRLGPSLEDFGWLNPILGIPDPANLLNRLEQEAERRRRRRRGLSRADIEELRRRLESLASEYGLNLAQIREITRWVRVGDNLEPDDTRISSDL